MSGQYYREKRKESGLCTYCGLVPPDSGKHQCSACTDKVRAKGRERYKSSPDKFKIKSRERNESLKIAALEHYGGKCVDCGETDFVVIEFHHINGDGAAHRGGRDNKSKHTVLWFKQTGYPEGIEPLCANCHRRRHYIPPSRN